MKTPAAIGTRIRITGKSNSHDYTLGAIYQVHEIDDDGTFKAVDAHGIVGNYLKWGDCETVGIGWEWLRQQLDAPSLDLLGAFDGVGQLTLRPEIEAMIVASIPNLHGAILDILPVVEEEVAACAADGTSEEVDDIDLDELCGIT